MPAEDRQLLPAIVICRSNCAEADLASLVRQVAATARAGSEVVVTAATDPDSAFTEALERFHETGFYFVSPVITLPEGWDLRLLWHAQRHDGVAAVTPLIQSRLPESASSPASFDGLCYLKRTNEVREGNPVTWCLYVTPAGASVAWKEWSNSVELAGFPRFVAVLTRLRFRFLVAEHVCVLAAGAKGLPGAHDRIVKNLYGPGAKTVAAEFSFARVTRPRTLHVLHSWGGGLNNWVHEYCNGDGAGRNLVLKSVGTPGVFGCQQWLYADSPNGDPIARYALDQPITATSVNHEQYRTLLERIVEEYGVENIIVSSLIGHSLDVFRTGRPTVMVCHEFYPFCAALNITFGSTCHSCGEAELSRCSAENPLNAYFPNVPAASWLRLRSSFASVINERGISMIAPSPSVVRSYRELFPEIAGALTVIPHGARRLSQAAQQPSKRQNERLRVVILGRLSLNKGLEIVRQMRPHLVGFADLFLLGSGNQVGELDKAPHIKVIPEYSRRDLPELIAEINPDLALLPSVVPETFSYTLQELFDLGIPALATNLGSFADRIEDGLTGFLSEPSTDAMIARIRELSGDRAKLSVVRENLQRLSRRSLDDMIADYRRILRVPTFSSRAYFARSRGTQDTTRCQVFCRDRSRQAPEDTSTLAEYRITGDRQAVQLPLPPVGPNSSLRFDPSEMPGVFVLHQLALSDASGSVVWTPAHVTMEQFRKCAHASTVILEQRDREITLCAFDDDPRLFLPVHPDILSKLTGGHLTVEITCLTLDQSVAVVERECSRPGHRAELKDMLARLRAQQRRLAGGGFDLHELQQAYRRVRDLESSLSWRVTAPLRAVVGAAPALVELLRRRRESRD